MTSPIVVGSVAVEVTASANGFARRLREAITKEFKGAGIDKAIADALGGKAIKVPVVPDLDTGRLNAQLRALNTRQPIQIPVQVSTAQAVQQARSAVNTAQRAAGSINVPVNIDRSVLRQATSALGGLAGAARNVGAAIGVLGAIGSVGAAGAVGLAGLASAAGGAISLLGGLAAAAATAAGALFVLPGAAAAAAAGIGALALGFSGIGAALKAAGKQAGGGGGGGAVVDNARQIAQAERGVAAAERALQGAQRQSKKAQEDLNLARKAAVERIQDLSRELRGARLDEEEAAIRQEEAADDLAKAQASGDPKAIRKAQLAYNQAALAVENTKDSVEDLAAEKADADKKGVQGSDEVQAALERQRDAADALAGAVDSLASAHDALAAAQQKVGGGGGGGGVDAFAEAMAKLAPNAQAVVRALLQLKPAFESMQKAVQQALFAGVAADLLRLGRSILPTLRAGFVGVADAINGHLRAALAELSTANTRIRLGQIFDGARDAIDRAVVAIRPLIRAFVDVAGVGASVIPALIGPASEVIATFAKHLSEMAKSGELLTLIHQGLAMLAQLGAAAKNVFGIISGIFNAAGASDGGGLFALLRTLNGLVNSIAGQTALTNLFTQLGRIGSALAPVLLAVAQALVPVAKGIADIAVAAAPVVEALVVALGPALARLAPAFIALLPAVAAIATAFGPLATILADLVVGAAPGITALFQGLAGALAALAPVAAPVGEALGNLAKAVAPLLPLIGNLVAVGLANFANVLSELSLILAPVIDQFSAGLSQALAAVVPSLVSLGRAVLPVVARAATQIARAFAPLVPLIAQVGVIFAQQLVAALPKFAGVVSQLVPVVASLAEQFGQYLLIELRALLPILPSLIGSGLQLATAFLQLIVAVAPLLPPLLKLGLLVGTLIIKSGAFGAALGVLLVAIRLATGVVYVIGAAVGALTRPFGAVSAAARKLGDAVRDGVNNAANMAKGLPGRIASAVGDLSRTLFNAGKSVIQGLIDGISSKVDALKAKLGAVTALIPKNKGPLDKDRRLLLPAGTAIMQGLMTGIDGQRQALQSQLGQVSADIAGGVMADLTSRIGVDGAVSLTAAGGAAAAMLPGPADPLPPQVRVFIGDRELTDIVRVEMDTRDRGVKRAVMAGAGVRR